MSQKGGLQSAPRRKWLRGLTYREQLRNMQSNPFQGETGRWTFLPAFFCAECKLFWLSDVDDWRHVPKVAGFKIGVLDMWSKPFSAGEVGSWRFAPDWREHKSCTGLGFMAILCSAFPTHFSVDVFSVAGCIGIAQLVFGFSSEKTALCVAVYLACP